MVSTFEEHGSSTRARKLIGPSEMVVKLKENGRRPLRAPTLPPALQNGVQRIHTVMHEIDGKAMKGSKNVNRWQ